jgi:DNA-3-methyladenine glycosylase
MKLTKLNRAFYQRDTLTIARELLGMRLVRRSKDGTTSGIIVETEAYIGFNDKASHASRGMTKRNEIMFRPGGYAYVYFIYGMHYCCNIVTEKAGFPAAVLLRALEPLEGIDIMAARRGTKELTDKAIVNLTNGPSKLCRAMGIDKALNGADLCGNELYLARPENPPAFDIVAAPRVNIPYSGEAIHYPWRFFIKGNKFVSK